MSSRSAVALGAVVVVLAGLAAWAGAHLAHPSEAPAVVPARDPDVGNRLDELDRRVGYLDRRLDAIEGALGELRRTLEDAGPARPVVPGAADPAGPRGPDRTAPGVAPVPKDGEPAREPTDAELQEQRLAQIEKGWRDAAARFVPARLLALADDRPAAAEKRRHDALLEARSVAMSLSTTEDQLDPLVRIYQDQAERLARDVGPLVRDGLEHADVAAVQAQLDLSWAELDRRVKELVGPELFERFSEEQAVVRGHFRTTLEGYRPKPPPPR
jgi:hypothetical protein